VSDARDRADAEEVSASRERRQKPSLYRRYAGRRKASIESTTAAMRRDIIAISSRDSDADKKSSITSNERETVRGDDIHGHIIFGIVNGRNGAD